MNRFYDDKTFHVFLFGHFYDDRQEKLWETTFFALYKCLNNRYKTVIFYFASDGKTRTVPDAFMFYLREQTCNFDFKVSTLSMSDHEKQNLGTIFANERETLDGFDLMKPNPENICIAFSFLFEGSSISRELSEELRLLCRERYIKFSAKLPGEKPAFSPDFNCITRTPFYHHESFTKPPSSAPREFQEYPAPRKRVISDVSSSHPSDSYHQLSSYHEDVPPPKNDTNSSYVKDDARLLTAEQIHRITDPIRRENLLRIRELPGDNVTTSKMFYHADGSLAEIRITTSIFYP